MKQFTVYDLIFGLAIIIMLSLGRWIYSLF